MRVATRKCFFLITLSRSAAFLSRQHEYPAKIKISLRIRAVIRVFAGHSVGSNDPKRLKSVAAQTDFDFRYHHMPRRYIVIWFGSVKYKTQVDL